jgi:hypothetical protein
MYLYDATPTATIDAPATEIGRAILRRKDSEIAAARTVYRAAVMAEVEGKKLNAASTDKLADAMSVLGYGAHDFDKHVRLLSDHAAAREASKAADRKCEEAKAKLPLADEMEERIKREAIEARMIRHRYGAAEADVGLRSSQLLALERQVETIFGKPQD